MLEKPHIDEEKTISFEKHREIGMMCKILNERLIKRYCEICREHKTKKEGKKMVYHYIKANEALSKFKNHMEEIMFREYPKEANLDVYYGERPKDFEESKEKQEMKKNG